MKKYLPHLMWLAHPIAVAIGVLTWYWCDISSVPPLWCIGLELAFLGVMLLIAGRFELLGNVRLFHWELLILMFIAAEWGGTELHALREGIPRGADDYDVAVLFICIYLFWSHVAALSILFGEGIHLAAALNLTPVMKRLLKEGGYRLNMRAANENTALIVAAKYNRMKAVRLLLEYRADKTPKNARGKTAADYALENGNQEMYVLLKVQ